VVKRQPDFVADPLELGGADRFGIVFGHQPRGSSRGFSGFGSQAHGSAGDETADSSSFPGQRLNYSVAFDQSPAGKARVPFCELNAGWEACRSLFAGPALGKKRRPLSPTLPVHGMAAPDSTAHDDCAACCPTSRSPAAPTSASGRSSARNRHSTSSPPVAVISAAPWTWLEEPLHFWVQ
jgi:hypothetical protein